MKDIVIQVFDNVLLAELAQTKLKANEIKSVTEEMDFSGSSLSGGISSGRTSLRVLEKDVQKAKELLNIK